MIEHSALILTLQLDQKTFDRFNQLRQQYFPSEKSFLLAHVTLFHKLPGEQEQTIHQVLQAQCDHMPILHLTFSEVRSLGRGVAIGVDCLELVQLRQQLATAWNHWLSRQDQQGYWPHITIQNKAAPEAARQLYEQLLQEWQPCEGRGEGLLLWRYKGGPWEFVKEFGFR